MSKGYMYVLIFFLTFSIAQAIEVGGHLTEDTVWSPGNNPYEVTETLFVDAGVTLTILPGTEIKISGASLTDYIEYHNNFGLFNGVSVAKYIQVDGQIIAEGTEQDSIVFTRLQDDMNYNWGSIFINYDAELCVFKHCVFEHMGNIVLALSNTSYGLSFYNGKGIVRDCCFLNCTRAISSGSYEKSLEIIDNEFLINEGVNPYLPHFNYGKFFIQSFQIHSNAAPDVLICHNVFDGYDSYFGFGGDNVSYAFNSMFGCVSNGGNRCFIYDNTFEECNRAVNGGDSLYIKNNRFIEGDYGVYVDHAYAEISDNYFEGCDLYADFNTSGTINNNALNNGSLQGSGLVHCFNNISYNTDNGIGLCTTFQRLSCTNNVSINNRYAFEASDSFDNGVFLYNDELTQFGVGGNPIFRNCIIDFPLDPPLVDGGGNIIVDSLQAQSIFEDIQNGDFHLAPGSIAIDAGFDTLGYYYPFDMENNIRVWDGDGDGNAVIDIGAYEYGAPALGKICGYITETTSGEPVNYVLIKANNQPGKFTFADSSGYFEIQLSEGVYDLYAERVFYEDAIVYSVSVENGLSSEVDFNMTYDDPMVSVSGNELNINNSKLNISNYPNPFNPTTTISYSIPAPATVELSIYNVKGQKVVTLVNQHQEAGEYATQWNGTDSENNPVASGVYFYRLSDDHGNNKVQKCLLLK